MGTSEVGDRACAASSPLNEAAAAAAVAALLYETIMKTFKNETQRELHLSLNFQLNLITSN